MNLICGVFTTLELCKQFFINTIKIINVNSLGCLTRLRWLRLQLRPFPGIVSHVLHKPEKRVMECVSRYSNVNGHNITVTSESQVTVGRVHYHFGFAWRLEKSRKRYAFLTGHVSPTPLLLLRGRQLVLCMRTPPVNFILYGNYERYYVIRGTATFSTRDFHNSFGKELQLNFASKALIVYRLFMCHFLNAMMQQYDFIKIGLSIYISWKNKPTIWRQSTGMEQNLFVTSFFTHFTALNLLILM